MAVKYFTPNYQDVLIGTKKADRFVVGRPKNTFWNRQDFPDAIANYQRDDVIDLPGSWGKGGRGVRLSPIYSTSQDWDWRRAEVIKPGSVGVIRMTDTPAGFQRFCLICNYDSRRIYSNEDIILLVAMPPSVDSVFVV